MSSAFPGPPASSAPSAQARWPRRRAQARALVVLWLAWVAALAWFAPAKAPASDLAADLAAHRVVGYETTDTTSLGFWAALVGGPSHSSSDPGEQRIVWHTPDARSHWVRVEDLGGLDALGSVRVPTPADGSGSLGSVTVGTGSAWSEARNAAVVHRVIELAGPSRGNPWRWTPRVLGWAVTLLALGFVVAGTPAHGTKWYWFWLVAMPAGLGTLAFIGVELYGTTATSDARRRGWHGFLVNFLVSSVLQTAVAFSVA